MSAATPIVIVSTGRTGTVFFAKLFRDVYPQVAAYHERGASRPIQILTNLHFARLFPLKGLESAWKLLKGREIKNCAKPFHLDANCFLYGLVALAPHLYQDLRVIHVVRDPRTYVTSHLSFARQRRRSFIANYLTPFWQPNPFLTGELAWKKLFTLSRFERYCWIWDFKNRVMESLEGTQTHYLRVLFEDVFLSGNPEEQFSRITDFIGLPRAGGIQERFAQPANRSVRQAIPNWLEWTPLECAQLQAHCGERMKQYGYGSEPEWRAILTEQVAGNRP
jgi:hypothetical protein